MQKILLIAAGVMLVAAFFIVIYSRRETRRVMDSLDQMLREVMQGSFAASHFDESRLSRLETEFVQYLSASALSVRNIEQEKDKMKTLIADISHQTKTPIANLLLYSELLEEEELTETAGEKLAALHGQVEKLQFLIEALVKLSRLENGIISLHPQEQEVGVLLNEMRQQYEKKARQKGLALEVKETETTAVCDAGWTAEALGNLVDNAIKYTRSGSVQISATAYELFTRIDVTDTGIGIPEEERPKIFQRFYRSQNAAKESREGVGIGLFLAREIVSNEGGYLKVAAGEGSGTVFSMFLPR